MRPNLHLITEHRSRRHRAARPANPGRLRNAAETVLAPREPQEERHAGEQQHAQEQPAREQHTEPQSLREDLCRPDVALRRVRESGGPIDHASYVCECGYVFEADVSTTVECPHCATPQAW